MVRYDDLRLLIQDAMSGLCRSLLSNALLLAGVHFCFRVPGESPVRREHFYHTLLCASYGFRQLPESLVARRQPVASLWPR